MNNIKWNKYIRKKAVQKEAHGMDFKNRICDLNMIANLINFQDKKILDIGCEEGYVLNTLQKTFNCDVNGLTMKIFKENENIIEGDMHELPYEDNSFDIVLIMHTLEHSIAPYIVLSEIHRILKKQGVIVIIMPEEGDFNTTSEPHYMTLTFRQMFNLLHKTNFKPIYDMRKVFDITPFESRNDIIAIWQKSDECNDLNFHIIPILCNKVMKKNIDAENVSYYAVKEVLLSSKDISTTYLGKTDSLK